MNLIKSKSGQGSVEIVLVTVAIFFFASFIFKTLRDQEVVSKLVDGPWEIMSGMIENGVWGTPGKTKIAHPNYLHRHISLRGIPES